MNADEKVDWCRAMGVVQAQWGVDGDLLMVVLGPERIKPDGQDPEAKMPASDEPTPDELLLMSA